MPAIKRRLENWYVKDAKIMGCALKARLVHGWAKLGAE